MMKGIIEAHEKGMTYADVKDDVEKTVMKEHDPMDTGDEYIVGVFGSAFGCMRVSFSPVNLLSIEKILCGQAAHFHSNVSIMGIGDWRLLWKTYEMGTF